MIMEFVFLSVFLARFFHGLTFQEPKVFWKDPKNLTVLVTIIVRIFLRSTFSKLTICLQIDS